MWMLPTRMRPANMVRFIDAWHRTGASTPLLLLLDGDDPTLNEYKKLTLPDIWKVHIAPERHTLVQLYNDAVAAFPNEPWYGGLSDDMLPQTPHWDTELVKSAGRDKVAWPNDLIAGPYLPTTIAVGGDLIRELGWFLLPDLVRLYGDTVWALIAKKRNAARYREDIIVEHLHFGVGKAVYDETAKKPSAMQDRAAFDKWRWSYDPTVNFVTVKWGTKYSADYVNILFDMIARHLPPDFGRRFICFTDDASGIDEGIEIRPLPEGLTGWWNKLYLFKQNVFEEGERVFFLDLDTLITGGIADIAGYKGEFAILRDFYRPQGFGSGIMMWRGGFGAPIWDSYVAAGMPQIEGGDQAWIERCRPRADILQDLYLGAFASFKEKGMLAPPPGGKIVCFHGDPRPHQVKGTWVERVWTKGGETNVSGEAVPAADPLANVRHALTLPFTNLQKVNEPHPGAICIVGGGASARDCLGEIRARQQQGCEIWALDGAYAWLAGNGIIPNAHVMLSPEPANAAFVPEKTEASLLYASQCHPDVFAKAAKASNHIIIWHPMIDGIRAIADSHRVLYVGGGTTTGMLAISLAFALGCRNLHLYGFDSSYREDEAGGPDRIQITVDGRAFQTSMRLAQQVNEFRMILKSLMAQKTGITLHGDGLLPFVMQQIAKAAQDAQVSA